MVWWEYLLLIIPSLLISFFVEFCMKDFNADDTEYLGYYITKITHYDAWNEYIHKTCTREVEIGRDSNGKKIIQEEEYDCSYVENHPERWTYTLNNGNEEYFYDRREFEEVQRRFNVSYVFRDMHRHYHTIDGDAQDYFWDKSPERMENVTVPNAYENRLKTSRTILKKKKVSKKEAKKLGLFDYPEIKNRKQPAVLGIKLPESQTRYIDNINGFYGKECQIRIYMLFFKNGTPDLAEYQRCYWQGGNKNEIVFCLGYDSISNKVTWCEGFSWSDVPLLETKARQYFLDHSDLDLKKFSEFIVPYIKSGWKRKSFADFKYINIELTLTQYIWIFVITVLYNVLISWYIVSNNYRYEK